MTNDDSGNVADATLREFAKGQKLFGRYTLVKILGRGGMGIVWLARDEELEREVALKFLPDIIIRDREVLNDLKRETRRSLELTHQNIVRIYDFVHDERSGCISMEYVDGETLASMRCGKPQKVFEPVELSAWTSQLCDALDYAHKRARIIHRDLKPANLMVSQRGDLKISDFGIARSLGDSMSMLTREQGRSGTLVYMSPQQLAGERGTHLDDVYSLGATLYDLLTSKPPFYSGNIDRQIQERVAPSMTERREELDIEPALIPAVWEEVVAACLAKDPTQRPQSTADVAQQLQIAPAQTRAVPPFFGKGPTRKRLFGAGVAALLVVAFAGWYFGLLKRHSKPVAVMSTSQAQAAAISEKSIAVLPFENLSANQENAFFTDGVQDEILIHLAQVADLKVISRISAMQYKSGVARNLREIAQQLGVAHVLEGSVQRAANRVRVNAQLIDARTDAHLWAQHYDRDLEDVFAIQTEIAKAIAEQLQAKLSPREKVAMEQQPTSDLLAFEFYTRAKTLLSTTSFSTRGKDNLLQAVHLLDQAIARDPGFLRAYCQLASAHDQLYFLGLDHTPARLALGDAAVKKALSVRPESGEAHLARARHLYQAYLDYDAARAEIELAQRTMPNDPLIFELLGYIDRRQGRWEESARNLERALELDPRNFFTLQQISLTYNLLRRYREMAAVLDRALTVVPDDLDTKIIRAQVDLDWRADLRPFRRTIEAALAKDPAVAPDLADAWLLLALCEHDSDAASRALAALTNESLGIDAIQLSRAFGEALAARARGDDAAARLSFTIARAEQEKILQAQPDYAPALCVLGLIDAGLGRKDEALREGREAVKLLPITKDSVNGAHMIEFLAIIYAWTGEKDLACQQLEILAGIPSTVSYGQLRLHPFWDPLRGDPRFEKIVASLAPK